MSILHDGLISAYLTNSDFRGAIVKGIRYAVNPDLSYAVYIQFDLHHCPSYDPAFWLTDAFELDKCVIGVYRTESGSTEIAFRNPDYDRSLFSSLKDLI